MVAMTRLKSQDKVLEQKNALVRVDFAWGSANGWKMAHLSAKKAQKVATFCEKLGANDPSSKSLSWSYSSVTRLSPDRDHFPRRSEWLRDNK